MRTMRDAETHADAGIVYRPAASLAEGDLSMPRRKPRSAAISLAFRLTRLLRAIGLERFALRVLLKASWVCTRLAYEISSERIGPVFETSTRGVTEELLARTIAPGSVVLDLGCGGGRLTRMAARLGGEIVAVDLSPANIERARAYGIPPNVEYICGDARDVLLRRHFDVVLLVHVLEHIENADAFLQLLRTQASKTIIEVPNFEADALNSVRVAMGAPFYTDADHMREYTPAILRGQLERNGWRVVEQEIRGASIVAVASSL